jgi:cytochrome c-type biogenesis protein
LAFVAAFTLVFTLMGATATFIGSWLLHFQRIILVFFSVIMLVMGLHLGGFVRIPFLMREKRLGRIENKGTLLSSFLLGLVFALGWSPCVGPVLASMLILAAEKSTVLKGMGLLFVYSIGLGIPFILSALVLQRSARLLQGIKRHLGLIEKLGGAALVFMALWMIFRGGSL